MATDQLVIGPVPEGLAGARVAKWLIDNVPGLQPPFRFSLLAGGHSNLTFGCDDAAGARYVVRRPPLSTRLQSAHDMAREHRIMSALADTAVPVPPTFGLCQDPSVTGADFYVSGFVDGHVLGGSTDGAEVPDHQRALLGRRVADILAELHHIDPDDVGLGDLGRKDAYLERQMKRWVRQWEASKAGDLSGMDECVRLLEQNMPSQQGASIVHGDYRLGNMIVADGDVRAVLDWELCTLGDPLADVAYVLNNWLAPDEIGEPARDDHFPTAAGGFGSRDDVAQRYADQSGRDLSGIDYYRAFGHWRLAVICQGVLHRYQSGAMGSGDGVELDQLERDVTTRLDQALELLARR